MTDNTAFEMCHIKKPGPTIEPGFLAEPLEFTSRLYALSCAA